MEHTRIATLNLLEDLTNEKLKVDIAVAKEETTLLSIGDGLIATDENGIITKVNKAAEKLLDFKKSEAIGKKYVEVVQVMDKKGTVLSAYDRPMGQALRGMTVSTTTLSDNVYYFVRKKIKFPVALTVTPVMFGGKVKGTVEIFRDITKEKEVDTAKTEFVALASHQLRTPLTTVSWYSEMLLSGDIGGISPHQKKYLDEIYTGNKRMIELVNTLLNVSRLELGTLLVEPQNTDIVEVARSVLEEQKLKIVNKKLKLVTNFDKNIPTLLIDPKQLAMVLQNLIANAVTYTPHGGRIELGISIDKTNHILLKVSDTGIGIPKKQQEKIFVKFFRADNAREKDTGGTGLGLYIAKSIVENADGKIWFASEENKGTTFYVSLPLHGKVSK